VRILFLGTPEYAVPSLRRLAAEHEVVGVVAQPDQPVGRRGAPQAPPVAEFARAQGLRLFQPERPGRQAFIAELAALRPELSVVIAYGHILRPALIELAPQGTINAHGSLLPKYRGAAPIQRAILAGEAETGVTVQKVVFEVDAGPILLQERLGIGPEETAGELFARMAELSAECLSRAVRLIESGQAVFSPQDVSAATFAPKLTKEEGRADWSRPADHLARAARAYNPWPALSAKLPGGRRLKILRARVEAGSQFAASARPEPGTVLLAAGDDFVVATGSGALRLLEVQAEGKKPMGAAEFLRGARLAAGARLS
jgi:methionyl-tRNA formyltransferase